MSINDNAHRACLDCYQEYMSAANRWNDLESERLRLANELMTGQDTVQITTELYNELTERADAINAARSETMRALERYRDCVSSREVGA